MVSFETFGYRHKDGTLKHANYMKQFSDVNSFAILNLYVAVKI